MAIKLGHSPNFTHPPQIVVEHLNAAAKELCYKNSNILCCIVCACFRRSLWFLRWWSFFFFLNRWHQTSPTSPKKKGVEKVWVSTWISPFHVVRRETWSTATPFWEPFRKYLNMTQLIMYFLVSLNLVVLLVSNALPSVSRSWHLRRFWRPP